MPRIVIVHAALGTGRTSAADALAEAFHRKRVGEMRMEDILNYGSRLTRRAMLRSYLDVTGGRPRSGTCSARRATSKIGTW